MSHISLESLLESFSPLVYKNGGRYAEGEQAWLWFKRWADINTNTEFIYKVLNTIKLQNYQASQKQQSILDKWLKG
jgi:hypothetical protein